LVSGPTTIVPRNHAGPWILPGLARTTVQPAAARDLPPRVELTPREYEVLALLCLRLTDREIADRLFIGQRTVSNHVGNILAKLGASNRREAAALATRFALV
jgi:DNA-binding CsgD family transcriptional regulator